MNIRSPSFFLKLQEPMELYWQVKLKLLQTDYQTQRIILREYLWPYKALQLSLGKPK